MRVSLLAAAALMLQDVRAETTILPQLQSVDIFYQPMRSLPDDKSSLLASVKYNVSNLESTVLSYSPPATSDTTTERGTSHPLFRISTNTPDGSTTVTSLSTFSPTYTQTLTLHLRDDDLVLAASISAEPLVPSRPTPQDPKTTLKVVVVRPQPGPTPKLNVRKPVVVGADGKEVPQEPEAEKTFFQKYWWAFALVAVLALAGGGDK
ncbi:hypothetical protein EPUS_02325 [Endocarpon pusillum Z07020]|uniref:ER membrane protein complex subunit 10 n=1 Tax=Endocarpon pusillum (strain Z07020 / HMAS-L-300199) TaxID=1263415 RepID=U1GXD8_ENDPU|nr:uncharacterized protein EPUS_02325 [Endocarpon pusillum Z07020]ERF76786.1 hypothetical protein EPUS_02325 [Endocarpon pusillum Z07020]